jgi:hypothetical protein
MPCGELEHDAHALFKVAKARGAAAALESGLLVVEGWTEGGEGRQVRRLAKGVCIGS